jgi:hypothetical protein
MIKYLDNNLAVGGTAASIGIGGERRPSSNLNQNEIRSYDLIYSVKDRHGQTLSKTGIHFIHVTERHFLNSLSNVCLSPAQMSFSTWHRILAGADRRSTRVIEMAGDSTRTIETEVPEYCVNCR